MNMNLDKKILNLTFQQKNAFKRAYLKKLHKVTPQRFEELVEILLDNMEYQNVEVTKRTGDGGVDVTGSIINGITKVRIAIQVKRLKNKIGRKVLDELRGSLHRFNATQGVIITTSDFSKNAIKAANELGAAPITLINGTQLVELLVKYKIGVREIEHTTIQEDNRFWGEKIEQDHIEQGMTFQAPQADNLYKIIDIINAVDKGYQSLDDISEYLQLGRRQGRYYCNAAQLLGLAKINRGSIDVSPLGKSLIYSTEKKKIEILKNKVLTVPLIQEILIFIKLQKLSSISIDELSELIENYANLAPTTAKRRAQTIASWLVGINYAKRIQDELTFNF